MRGTQTLLAQTGDNLHVPIPERFKPLWDALYNEVVALHARWLNFEMLFGKSPERVKKLYELAPAFFYILQTTLIDDVQLALGRLADPAETGRRANATLNTLLAEITASKDAGCAQSLKEVMGEFEAACVQVRTRRNKLIAHYDRRALLDQFASASDASAKPPEISQPTRDEIRKALAALASVMNSIEAHYASATTAYHLFRKGDDANSLVWTIKCGLRYQELVKSGVIRQEYLLAMEAYTW